MEREDVINISKHRNNWQSQREEEVDSVQRCKPKPLKVPSTGSSAHMGSGGRWH